MDVEQVDVLVVGGGQAGLAMSAHLTRRGVRHLVLERGRIAERWRAERWDSLVANGPAWHDRFPEMTFAGLDPDGFAGKDQVVAYLEAYAAAMAVPIRCGVTVLQLRRHEHGQGFRAVTSQGTVDARSVVAATGPFQRPLIPAMVPATAGAVQIHSAAYRNPAQLPGGAVLVIGAGSSGAQIADELLRAGRTVFLSVGPHNRPPRRYRGHDYCWWLGELGKWSVKTPPAGAEHVTIAVSGAQGGQTVDFRELAGRGMALLGRATSFADGVMQFAPDLAASIVGGDRDYLSVLDEADAYVDANRLALPQDAAARRIGADPECLTNPILSLDLAAAGIGAIVWATGYGFDFDWLQVDVLDEAGRPRHQDGVSSVPGLYFLGLPWLTDRSSSFIWGVWRDAQTLSEHVALYAGAAEAV